MKATEILMEEHKVILRVIEALEAGTQQLESGAEVRPGFFLDAADFIKGFADGCHHKKEEGVLFRAMGEHGMPTDAGPIAVMLSEHEQGRAYTRGMREAANRLAAGDASAKADLAANARGYAGLLRNHIEKENGILFPMADQVISGRADQEAVAEGFEHVEHEETGEGVHEKYLGLAQSLEREVAADAQSAARVLDVRNTPPPQRHPLIFGTFESLAPGSSFELVNDHDPKPLYYQFRYEREGSFTWDYVEQGPQIWRVRIGKPQA